MAAGIAAILAFTQATICEAREKTKEGDSRYVTEPNYALAERFSAERTAKMVFTTQVRPMWLRDGSRFIYQWKTSQGTQYYLADPKAGICKPVFDLEKLAMQITEITRDPFDSQHIPMTGFKIDPEDDNYLNFDIRSTQEKKDTTKAGKGKHEKVVYHFKYRVLLIRRI